MIHQLRLEMHGAIWVLTDALCLSDSPRWAGLTQHLSGSFEKVDKMRAACKWTHLPLHSPVSPMRGRALGSGCSDWNNRRLWTRLPRVVADSWKARKRCGCIELLSVRRLTGAHSAHIWDGVQGSLFISGQEETLHRTFRFLLVFVGLLMMHREHK